MVSLLDSLKKGKCYLLTDEFGKELLDKEGNLIICKPESGDLVYVPNTVAIRELYDLPVNNKSNTNKASVTDKNSYQEQTSSGQGNLSIDYTNLFKSRVWGRVPTPECKLALKALTHLVASVKYKNRFKNGGQDNLSVWEDLAAELKRQGFNIADNRKEAASRTYQKWKSFNKYCKYVSEHKNSKIEPKLYDEWLGFRSMDTASKSTENENTTSKSTETDKNSKTNPEISPETTSTMLRLMVSDWFDKIVKEVGRKKQWRKVCLELIKQGCYIPGKEFPDKVRKLCQKWRNMKKLALKHHRNKTRRKNIPRPKHYCLIMRIIVKEMKENGENCEGIEFEDHSLDIEAQNLVDHNYAELSKIKTETLDTDPLDTSESCKNTKESSTPLLTAQEENSVGMDFVDSDDEHFILPDTLCDESSLESCSSKTKTNKQPDILNTDERANERKINTSEDNVSRHTDDEHVGESNKGLKHNIPQFVGANTEGNVLNSIGSSTAVNPPQSIGSNSRDTGNDERMGDIGESEDSDNDSLDSDSCDSESAVQILKQIKNLQEAAMVKQQENFSRVISLMEEQVKNQRTLNEMFLQYVSKRSNKSRSHSGS